FTQLIPSGTYSICLSPESSEASRAFPHATRSTRAMNQRRVTETRIVHTADLDETTRASIRALLWNVFDDMTEHDWEHCQGGSHAIAAGEDGTVIGHAALVMRRLLHGERALRTGYVEGVAVRADHRRRGIGGAVMAPLERMIERAFDVGALG